MALAVVVMAVAASTALQIKGQIKAAEDQAQEAFLQEKMIENDRRASQTQAIQEETIRREELRRVLSAGAALEGGAGASISSRSFLAGSAKTRELVERDIVHVRVMGQSNDFNQRLSIAAAQNRQDSAITQGELGAWGALAAGVGQVAGGFAGYQSPQQPAPVSLFDKRRHGRGQTVSRVG